MRIVLDYRPALRDRSGVGEYVHELARALVAVTSGGAEHQIVAFSSSWKDRLDLSDLPGVQPADVRVPVRALNLAWHRLGWPPVERFAGRVDVAHSGHPLLMPARHAAQVVTIHDLDFLEHPERTTGEIRRDYPALVHQHARKADLIVVSSRSTQAQVHDVLGVARDRILFCPAGAPAWEPRSSEPASPYFLFVGTLEPRKNVATLLDAYERLVARRPDVAALRMAGRAADGSEDWLSRLRRPPLSGRVEYLGYVDARVKRDLYAGALALIVPSLHEGFGLTALEAMRVGVPVVASNRGSLPEVLGDAALYVEADDPESIAAAMASVASDVLLRQRLTSAGLARAREFSWTRSAAALLDAYRQALARRRGKAR